MDDLISIIMPTYNRAYIIRQAIDSVLAQTYEHWELIIIDDGSSDNTISTVKAYHDKRIRFIRCEENKGANHARNVGISEICGNYLCFLDSDSTFKTTCLKDRIEFIKKRNIDFIWNRVSFATIDGEPELKPQENAEMLDDRAYIIKTHMLYGLIDTNSVFMSRDIQKKVGNFDERLPRLQDKEYFLRVISNDNYNVSFLDKCLVTSKLQKNSISLNSERLWESYAYILMKHLAVYKSRGILGKAFSILFHLDNEKEEVALSLIEKLNSEDRERFIRECIKYIAYLKDKCKKMEWRFPRDKISSNSRVIIYGAGTVGKSFVRQLRENHYCDVVLWVDKNYLNCSEVVHSPKCINEFGYDYIIIAIADNNVSKSVMTYLVDMGVETNKIIKLCD